MARMNGLEGQVFGRLAVSSAAPNRRLLDGKSYRYWICVCACGNTTEASTGNLRSGNTSSCGCWQKERASESNSQHRLTRSPEFNVWAKMRQRCANPNSKDWVNYGGRGILVCPEWKDFSVFLRDMGKRPSPAHQIERRNNDQGYSLSNCYWATIIQQRNNMRNNHLLTFQGRTMTTTKWAREMGVDDAILHKRVHRGWPVERILTQQITGGAR